MSNYPSLEQIRSTHKALQDEIVETPVIELQPGLFLKLELQQKTGSFKLRGALNFMRSLTPEQLNRGVTAFSAGNHAIAVAYAARILGATAKVAMPLSANPDRVKKCKSLGAEVIQTEKRTDLPLIAKRHETEGRTLVHPFDHPRTIEGAAGVGLELINQVKNLDVVFVPIGGGGLAAGVACAIKQAKPNCKIIGVQALSADAMYRSFQTGRPERNENPNTVADSLCPPLIGSFTYATCKQFLDGIVRIEETDIKAAMQLLKKSKNLIVEGAGAISLAAALTNSEFNGKTIGAIISGSNIDLESFEINSRN